MKEAEARVALRMAIRSCAEASELLASGKTEDSQAQVSIAIGFLNEYRVLAKPAPRRIKERKRYLDFKKRGICCRCIKPPTKGVFCDEHHAKHKAKEEARRKKAK